MKTSHRIRVLGREIQVRSAATAEAVRTVEEYVNCRLAEVASSLPNADQQLVTLLTLLNIAESYLSTKSGAADVTVDDAALQRIVQKIDRTLGEDIPRRVNI